MASMAELYQIAQAQQQAENNSNPVANAIASGIQGGAAGFDAARQERAARLDQVLKMIDIRDKMAKAQREQADFDMRRSLMSQLGLLPSDKPALMSTGGKLEQAIQAGRLSGFAEKKSPMAGMEPEISFPASGGVGVTFKKPKEATKAPPGFRFLADGSLEAIPGGPADTKANKEKDKTEALKSGAVSQADRIIIKVDQAMEKVSGWSAGAGSKLSAVPGSDAKDLSADLKTIKANLGFAELQAMRASSPTGGALGQIAVQELEALQATLTSLEQDQSPAQLKQHLSEVREHYQKWRDAVNGSESSSKPEAKEAAKESAGESKTINGKTYVKVNGEWYAK